ncbi:hypothetical protein OUZ56_010297 [Daphnia magna]|uniref:Uncharacterized protein n=1 Tax=Daphnia magna TaxID=35525 RepID=A0ABR0AIA2_9CRUS|nr:hypothetical protein OUZ56_010297 [Daphnia magna]
MRAPSYEPTPDSDAKGGQAGCYPDSKRRVPDHTPDGQRLATQFLLRPGFIGRHWEQRAAKSVNALLRVGVVSVERKALGIKDRGDREQFFAENWKQVTDEPWVFGTVSEGLILEFISEPDLRSCSLPVTMSKEMERLCDNEVTDLIRMSAIVEIVDYSKEEIMHT